MRVYFVNKEDYQDQPLPESALTTIRKQLMKELIKKGENWGDVIGCTLSDSELDETTELYYEFNAAWSEKHFALWTKNNVYFSRSYRDEDWLYVVTLSRFVDDSVSKS